MDWPALYALQDRVLAVLRGVEQEFYLTGGTALSRGYYHHRHSEDLDFFVNDRPEFVLWRDRCLAALAGPGAVDWKLEITLREARFGRAFVHGPVTLKLEFINDVPSRSGPVSVHPVLGRLDSRENILANKLTALVDRAAPKDLADIYWLCARDHLNLTRALQDADGKAAGIFPPLVAKRLAEGAEQGLPTVFWISPPAPDEYRAALLRLSEAVMNET